MLSVSVIKRTVPRKLRISAISFLNTAPLMWDFEHGVRAEELAKEFEISYTVPSLCAEALRKGEADIGIIPAITYQTIPGLVAIPDVAIAARGPVRSILLVSRVPTERIGSVAVDTSSRTSVALMEILFRKGWLTSNEKPEVRSQKSARAANHERPTLIPCEPNLERMLAVYDAALLIGDSALRVDRSKYHVIDLAEAWDQATRRPFVFAFWAIRNEALAEYGNAARLSSIFQKSRDHGLRHVAEIAAEWSPKLQIGNAEIRSYLTSSVSYSLDRAAAEGLSLFFELAKRFAIVPQRRDLQFAAQTAVAAPPR